MIPANMASMMDVPLQRLKIFKIQKVYRLMHREWIEKKHFIEPKIKMYLLTTSNM
ncbi:MAG: hypothetical protein ACI97P_001667 [Arcticibacterium sp.]|jgi:hypothetical protein